MSVMILDGLYPDSSKSGFCLAKTVFAQVLPTTNPWSVNYSNYGSHFDCTTKVEVQNSKGLLGMFIRFEITDDLELVVTKIGGSRKNSTMSWSGSRYGQYRDTAFKRDVKSWVSDLKSKGVRILEGALEG